MARRLSEAGVRFVEVCQSGWDHHTNLHRGLIDRCRNIDQPVSALLTDLRRRGLLEDTLVLFGSEFGRLPTAQGPDGRDHNITGYSMFLAGAGVKQGFSYGAPTNWVSGPSRDACTPRTCTRRCWRCWASITRNSRIGTRAANSA